LKLEDYLYSTKTAFKEIILNKALEFNKKTNRNKETKHENEQHSDNDQKSSNKKLKAIIDIISNSSDESQKKQ
jgi:hypothetical protein